MLAVEGRAAKDEMRGRRPRRAEGLHPQLCCRAPSSSGSSSTTCRSTADPRASPRSTSSCSEIEFLGFLGFVETLRELIPFDGFSDPPFLDVTPEGLAPASRSRSRTSAVGVFNLSNMSLGADVQVPFLGKSVTVGFNFCTRERPFTLAVAFIGGGGWFLIRLSPDGLDVLELGLEAGAVLAVDFGVASGSISAMLGIYIRLEGDEGSLDRLLPAAGRGRRPRPDLRLDRALPRADLRVRHRQDGRQGEAHDQGRGVLLLDLGDHLVPSAVRRLRSAIRASPT